MPPAPHAHIAATAAAASAAAASAFAAAFDAHSFIHLFILLNQPHAHAPPHSAVPQPISASCLSPVLALRLARARPSRLLSAPGFIVFALMPFINFIRSNAWHNK